MDTNPRGCGHAAEGKGWFHQQDDWVGETLDGHHSWVIRWASTDGESEVSIETELTLSVRPGKVK